MSAKKLISALVLGGMLMAGSAFAQTTTPTTTPIMNTDSDSTLTTSTPGVPNTGAGGDTAMNLLLLGGAALIAIGGAAYLSRRWAQQ